MRRRWGRAPPPPACHLQSRRVGREVPVLDRRVQAEAIHRRRDRSGAVATRMAADKEVDALNNPNETGNDRISESFKKERKEIMKKVKGLTVALVLVSLFSVVVFGCLMANINSGYRFEEGKNKNPTSFFGKNTSADTLCSTCHPGWMWYAGRWYYFSTQSHTWNSSLHFCTENNSTFAVIKDDAQLAIIRRLMDRHEYWIGLRKVGKEWKWMDNSTLEEAPAHDKPELNCACVDFDFYGALECSTTRHWICTRT